QSEVGETITGGENLPRQAQGARVEPGMKAAVLGWHDGLEEARFAQGLDSGPAGGVDILVGQRRQHWVRPVRQRRREATVTVVEKRPAQGLGEVHLTVSRFEAVRSPGAPTS